jgi:magnesium-transporting ATPase (P-type)
MNDRRTKILDARSGEVKNCKWSDIRVGDIVKVEKDQEVPADLLLVNAPKDIVFVSTMNLDGETNLKDRELCVTTLQEKRLSDFSGTVLCDEANASLDMWEGNLTSTNLTKIRPCNIKNLLLRGTTLRNIEFAFGICLYVGTETKIFMNSKKPPRKVSNLMKLMNKMLYTVFAFQIVIIMVFASLSLIWIE